ncbi:hypothetical protein [Brevundimonas naejangsanensis]|uniref:hypothetical protein n=1 Tax=Brevundimonas naejangsanensis TaxID=588932 RepID=UPI0003FC1006|nr:hypothetical protein [Brevundimonas naejangsanensis]
MVAIMAGAELGLAPFQALQSFAIVNNRPTLWGDGLMAVARAQGIKAQEWIDGEGDAAVAHCEVTRPDTGETIPRSFSVSDAKKAGLWNKQGPWQQYPKRMLQMRARAWALRDGCADMLRGFQVREEVEDYQTVSARAVPAERPNLAARLAAPNDAPREGFSAVHGLSDDDHIPDFDADTPSGAASNKPASDPASDPSDAGDPFPGDLPPAEDTTASGAEADADEGTSLAVDTIAWADRLIADLPFLRPEQIEALETDRKELAKFAVLKATDMAKARELEAAITAAKEG